MTNYERYNCLLCNHGLSNGFCKKFGLRQDEINGDYRDDTRLDAKNKIISNDDLRKAHGVHIPREGTRIDSTAPHLKDYIYNERCTEFKDD